jgi:hypothetical protein
LQLGVGLADEGEVLKRLEMKNQWGLNLMLQVQVKIQEQMQKV